MASGVISPDAASARPHNQPQRPAPAPRHDASISALLNDKQSQTHDDYLPTPVTPATAFPLIAAPALPSPDEPKRAAASDKPYACTECSQTFSRPHNLKSHLTTHSSERPFQCDICKNYFRRHHDLKRHRKLHTGERPYTCNVCHRSFARLDALNRHCRAEGGTACSNVHRLHARRPPPSSASPPLRPVVPQLHIANPASKPIASQIYPHPPPSTPAASPPPAANRHRDTLLPSPRALSRLPVSDNADLVPIHDLSDKNPPPPAHHAWTSSSSSSSSPPAPRDRILPLPSRYVTSPVAASDPWDRLRHENAELRQELACWQNAADQLSTLKSQLHDLQVENKVLRSLITEGADSDQPSKRKLYCQIREDAVKRRRNSD